MNILTLNAGSNSLKFEIVRFASERGAPQSTFGSSVLAGSYDDIGKENSTFALLENKRVRTSQQIEAADHGRATQLLFDWIEQGNGEAQGIRGLDDIHRIGHRVVHGADLFHGAVRVTDAVIGEVEELSDIAPLHNQSALKVIKAAQENVKRGIEMFAVFDTVFHQTIPDEAALYPLPPDIAQRHKIRRYGFHGISHRYLMLRYMQITGRQLDEVNLITMHLEGGSSVAAIRGGKSVDTSMGFTPLEGLMMGTRCGDIDPAIVTYLMQKEKLDAHGVEQFLNKECGLLGVSGVSADTRKLCEDQANPRVSLALAMFSYRVRKYVGAYLAALGGADAIVVGGGIGENSPIVRGQIFSHFGWCGAMLDNRLNEEVVDREGAITSSDSSLPVFVIPTQEGQMIAREVAECT